MSVHFSCNKPNQKELCMWVGGWVMVPGSIVFALLVHWNSCDGFGWDDCPFSKPSIVMLNLNPDTNLGTWKWSVCTPGVQTACQLGRLESILYRGIFFPLCFKESKHKNNQLAKRLIICVLQILCSLNITWYEKCVYLVRKCTYSSVGMI